MKKRVFKFLNYLLLIICIMIISFSCSLQNQDENLNKVGSNEIKDENIAVEKCLAHYPKFIQHIDLRIKGHSQAEKAVKKAYLFLECGNFRDFLALMSKDVNWVMEGMGEVVPFAGTFTGKIGVVNFLNNWSSSLVIKRFSFRYYLAENNRVNVHFLEEGIVKSTGKKYMMEVAHLWEIDDKGKVISFQGFNDCFAMYSAFMPGYNPQWSIQKHDADYNIPVSNFNNSREVVENLYNAFVSGDLPTVLNSITDNVVWVFAGNVEAVPFAGTYYGKTGVQQFMYNLFTSIVYTAPYSEILYVVDGCRVNVRQVEYAYSISTGRPINIYVLHSIILNEEGKATSFRSYNNTYMTQNAFDWMK